MTFICFRCRSMFSTEFDLMLWMSKLYGSIW